MNQIASLHCPYCKSPTEVTQIRCSACSCSVHGSFAVNEFAYLEEEDLHFLRMFLQFEGRIRDMEAPLGLSYPTIRNRLGRLKGKVFGNKAESFPEPGEEKQESNSSVLDDLGQGKVSFEEALQKLKTKKRGKI